ERVQRGGLRSRGSDRVRLRHGPRADRDAALRSARDSAVPRERPAFPEPVLTPNADAGPAAGPSASQGGIDEETQAARARRAGAGPRGGDLPGADDLVHPMADRRLL